MKEERRVFWYVSDGLNGKIGCLGKLYRRPLSWRTFLIASTFSPVMAFTGRGMVGLSKMPMRFIAVLKAPTPPA